MGIYIDEHIDDFDLEAALMEVSAQRREQALGFHHERGRRASVLAYLLLKRALATEYGIEGHPLLAYGAHGKPVLADYPNIHFSLSHCRLAVACAVGLRPVGIDIETTGRYREAVARYTMSDAELAEIRSAASPDVTFTRLWTMKEAAVKRTGEGLSDGLKTVLSRADRGVFTTVECLERGYVYTVCQ